MLDEQPGHQSSCRTGTLRHLWFNLEVSQTVCCKGLYVQLWLLVRKVSLRSVRPFTDFFNAAKMCRTLTWNKDMNDVCKITHLSVTMAT